MARNFRDAPASWAAGLPGIVIPNLCDAVKTRDKDPDKMIRALCNGFANHQQLSTTTIGYVSLARGVRLTTADMVRTLLPAMSFVLLVARRLRIREQPVECVFSAIPGI